MTEILVLFVISVVCGVGLKTGSNIVSGYNCLADYPISSHILTAREIAQERAAFLAEQRDTAIIGGIFLYVIGGFFLCLILYSIWIGVSNFCAPKGLFRHRRTKKIKILPRNKFGNWPIDEEDYDFVGVKTWTGKLKIKKIKFEPKSYCRICNRLVESKYNTDGICCSCGYYYGKISQKRK